MQMHMWPLPSYLKKKKQKKESQCEFQWHKANAYEIILNYRIKHRGWKLYFLFEVSECFKCECDTNFSQV